MNHLFSSRSKKILPGFRFTLGCTLFYLCLIVLIPLATLILKTSHLTLSQLWETISSPRVVASYQLTFLTSLAASFINAFFGFLVAWVLVRYQFPGKGLMDVLIDLPFALPTAVAGIALTAIYSSKGWVGRFLEPWGIKTAFSPLGITLALTFIGLPFVVRTVQPVLQDLDKDMEEAAACLGAKRFKIFFQIIFPAVLPALLTGFALSFARALGEYGSVVFISGNMPFKTEITSLLIITKLEQYDYQGATAIALVMLLISFTMLFLINLLQGWACKRQRGDC